MIRRTMLAAVTACAALGATDISAQTIGFKVGASFANWSVKEDNVDINTNAFTSFMGGGYIRFGTGRIAFQPELMAVTRGTEFSAEGADQFGVGRFKVDYIEVPLLLVLPFGTAGGVSPYIFGGPDFAFEYGCKVEVESGGFSSSVKCDAAGADVFERRKVDMGLTGGAGLQFPIGPGALVVEGRYNFGLTNISKASGVDIKSRTPAVLAGYSIPLTNR